MADTNEDAFKTVAKSMENFTVDFHKVSDRMFIENIRFYFIFFHFFFPQQNVAGKEKGNFVSSALSAHVVLSMAAYGAQGTTAEQMKKALHLPDKDTVANLGFQNFIDTFNVSHFTRY